MNRTTGAARVRQLPVSRLSKPRFKPQQWVGVQWSPHTLSFKNRQISGNQAGWEGGWLAMYCKSGRTLTDANALISKSPKTWGITRESGCGDWRKRRELSRRLEKFRGDRRQKISKHVPFGQRVISIARCRNPHERQPLWSAEPDSGEQAPRNEQWDAARMALAGAGKTIPLAKGRTSDDGVKSRLLQ